tara:strand:+ start:1499 stop:1612 length:114 start_codon:yes stop_codon:yes gene_type:complete
LARASEEIFFRVKNAKRLDARFVGNQIDPYLEADLWR